MFGYDAVIIGAGASGLFCALTAARRGLSVAVFDHNNQTGKKLKITGGGRCNFGNTRVGPENFLSDNPHFVLSALSRFKALDFKAFLEENGLSSVEERHGQLFCRQGAQAVADLLERLCQQHGVHFYMGARIKNIERTENFRVFWSGGAVFGANLVVAAGGLAWPQTGSSCFGYGVAETFGLELVEPRPALAPLVMGPGWGMAALSGISLPVRISVGATAFEDDLLFTHKGLSGPAALQISSYWRTGKPVTLNLTPTASPEETLQKARNTKSQVKTVLSKLLPARLAGMVVPPEIGAKPVAQLRKEEAAWIVKRLTAWEFTPKEVAGYKKAEVTAGGVNTKAISSKTMESLGVPGLYFTGEVMDVTGQLGGYNLHWAWASGYAAAQSMRPADRP
ncbi:Ferredoxin--NADP reductase [Fundidesulfovibrio magnetotacticus]|uniref:Ferredoxin--NADP reductase n=1 Tax=Fundidesulfovibrio magnetotacticus TaxID=2730080 RepID=A0A6V8LNR8_9BACT|nr:NAD(P)/FAD-dependent oxidoreductase [Fundidesulfovibrio magnetotacticus]GFK93344.1 Ferredoxin--NADP reductase [Fundidesulfovibrio magnetotacticus]